MDEHQVKEVSWNLSEAIIREIAEHLSKANSYHIQHIYDKQFDCLHSVKMRIIQRLDMYEINVLDNMEDIIYFNIHLINKKKSGFERDSEIHISNKYQLWKNVEKYNNLIMSALKKYGYDIPSKEDKTMMNA